MQKIKIAIIGMGLMGRPMSKNILKAGFALVGYNRTTTKPEEWENLGATVADTPSELATQSDVIITMVTAADDVRGILFGKDGVVHGAGKGLTVVDMSTIGPTAAKD